MVATDLHERLDLLYASVGATREADMSRMPARTLKDEKGFIVFQDFSGGLTPPEIVNIARAMFNDVAHLRDHIKRWLEAGHQPVRVVEEAIATSEALKIFIDLSNADKHGYPLKRTPRDPRQPRIKNVRRQMQLTSGAGRGATLVMQLGVNGVPQVSGDGTACAVVTGDVVGADGKPIGDLCEIAERAVRDWEALLVHLGVLQRGPKP